MGTNYYLHETPACPTCGHRKGEPLHIGKSSAGWCFSLHVEPVLGITSLGDWIDRWSKEGVQIVDEYGVLVTKEAMLGTITERDRMEHWPRPEPKNRAFWPYRDWADFHAKNHSQEGPNGLLRHQIGSYCVGHGDGTYDLIPGEFS